MRVLTPFCRRVRFELHILKYNTLLIFSREITIDFRYSMDYFCQRLKNCFSFINSSLKNSKFSHTWFNPMSWKRGANDSVSQQKCVTLKCIFLQWMIKIYLLACCCDFFRLYLTVEKCRIASNFLNMSNFFEWCQILSNFQKMSKMPNIVEYCRIMSNIVE